MLNTSTNLPRQIAAGDHVTFNTGEGHQAGIVNDLRRDLGNGELHARVELDQQWPGMFRAVPLKDFANLQRMHTFRTVGETKWSSAQQR